jgi:adenine-specific DNA-methyltransferase
VANKWMRANYGQPLRKWLKAQRIEEIIDFGDLPVFEGVTTYPCIIRIKKSPSCANFEMTLVKSLDFQSLREYVKENHYNVNQSALDDTGWSLRNETTMALLAKIGTKGIPLRKYVGRNIYRGILTGFNEAFIIDAQTRENLIAEDPKSAELIKPFPAGRNTKRYEQPIGNKYLIFARRGINIKEYPAIERHLFQFKERLMPKPKDWVGTGWIGRKPGAYKWFEIQDAIDYYAEFEKPKIVYPDVCMQPEFTFDNSGLYLNKTCFIISLPDKYLLGGSDALPQ